ncbi:MAG: hypothetical protein GF317_14305 [Candidatus Lokiarchaeota archaeon]|nr:hypothetical protein [Candidatus Lokiarchaeota archaeon]
MKYLVVGLEASGTKMVAKYTAMQLGITDKFNDWKGRNRIKNKQNEVIHRSLPYGTRKTIKDRPYYAVHEHFGLPKEVKIIICIRDITATFLSSLKNHNKENIALTVNNMQTGLKYIYSYLKSKYKCFIFSYEMALFLGIKYFWEINKFFELPIYKNKTFEIKNGNFKYYDITNKIYMSLQQQKKNKIAKKLLSGV